MIMCASEGGCEDPRRKIKELYPTGGRDLPKGLLSHPQLVHPYLSYVTGRKIICEADRFTQ